MVLPVTVPTLSIEHDDGTVRCPACHRGAQREAGERHLEWALYECPNCSLQHFWPASNPGADWYEANSMYCARDTVVDWLAWYQEEALRQLPVRSGKLLDVGCGNGTFVAAALARGFDAAGIDFSCTAIEMGRAHFGIEPLYCMSIAELRARFPGQLFDVVTAFEVLEHMDDVRAFLDELATVLRPGGYLVVSLPNRDRRPRMLNEGDLPPHHFTRWSAAAMKRVLAQHGFEVHSISINPPRLTMKMWLLNNVRLGLVMRVLRGAKERATGRPVIPFGRVRSLMLLKDRLAAAGGVILGPFASPFVRGALMVTIAVHQQRQDASEAPLESSTHSRNHSSSM